MALPRRIGKHPLTDKVVNAGIGKFGPYVTHDKVFASFDRKTHTYEHEGDTYNVLTIPMDAAVEMLRNTKKKAAPTALRELGSHPEDKAPVQIFEGKYGPYVKHGAVNATVPKDTDIGSITLEQAIQWLEAKASKGTARKTARKAARSADTKGAAKSVVKKVRKKKST
ncbi:MAG: hypothetical protein JNM43_21940 [Planctomycetaceae bacterium]|nr:hypothetical protein [Planctomycetaceae bacterium]